MIIESCVGSFMTPEKYVCIFNIMGADFVVHKTKNRNYYSSFSVWDTYRTQCQLVAMLYPKEASDMMQSVVDFAEQSGGYGRWVLANIETGIMQGDPTSKIRAHFRPVIRYRILASSDHSSSHTQ